MSRGVRAFGLPILALGMALVLIHYLTGAGRREEASRAQLEAPSRAPSESISPGLVPTEVTSREPDARSVRRDDTGPGEAAVTIVRVLDEARKPVPEARVQATRGADLIDCGHTSTEGMSEVAVDDLDCEGIVVSHPDYVTASLALDSPPAALVELVLGPGGRVPGRVRFVNGSSPGKGVRVFASKDTELPDDESMRRVHARDPRAVSATTDTDGTFELVGLKRDALYTALAGGKGCVSPARERATPFRVGQTLDLVVHRTFAAWVRIREKGGSRLRLAPTYGRRYGTARPRNSSVYSMSGRAPAAQAALDAVSIRTTGFADRLYVFSSPQSAPQVGPIDLKLDLPGYMPASFEFSVPSYEGGEPVEIVLELEPETESWAPLKVSFSSSISKYADPQELEPVGLIELVDAGGTSLTFAVRDSLPSELTLDSVPTGEYEWAFQTLDQSFSFPASGRGRARVTPTGGEIQVDLYALGAIELEIQRADASAYEGAAWILREAPGDHHLPARIFRGPPYVIGCVPAGTYDVWVDEPRFLDRTRETARLGSARVVVEPDTVSRATLSLPE